MRRIATWPRLIVIGSALSLAFGFAPLSFAAEPTVPELLSSAQTAARGGEFAEASKLIAQAITLEPSNPQLHYAAGQVAEMSDDFTAALVAINKAIELDSSNVSMIDRRGDVQLKLGNCDKAIDDFDTYLKVHPQHAPDHWRRGIAQYYAGKFADGRKQFELHQTVNSEDVENAVWHFLCTARSAGVEEARAKLIPIKGDTRVPMRQVHSLFAGQGTADDVIKAASADPSPEALARHMFYAHLYLGLYYEAIGDNVKAKEHILAADKYELADYMRDVARVHAKRLNSEPSAPPSR